jgi:hypothetical protein
MLCSGQGWSDGQRPSRLLLEVRRGKDCDGAESVAGSVDNDCDAFRTEDSERKSGSGSKECRTRKRRC